MTTEAATGAPTKLASICYSQLRDAYIVIMPGEVPILNANGRIRYFETADDAIQAATTS